MLTGYAGSGGVSKVYRNDAGVADLAIVKSITPRATAPGNTITYTLAFSNVGTGRIHQLGD